MDVYWLLLLVWLRCDQVIGLILSRDLLLTGLEKQRQGLALEAEAVYRQVLATEPQQPDALHLLGLLSFQRGDTWEGVDLIRQAVDADERQHVHSGGEGNPALYSNLGELLRSLDSIAEAAIILERGLQLYPNASLIAYNLAVVREDQGQQSEQEQLLSKVLELDQRNWKALAGLSSLAMEDGRYQRALELYTQALEVAGPEGEKDLLMGKGLAQFKLGQLNQAYGTFALVLQRHPLEKMARLNMAAMLQVEGKFSEALALYEECLEQDSTNVPMLNNKAAILLNTGREHEAADLIKHALQIDGNCSECLVNLATYHHEGGDIAEASSLYDRAYEMKQNIGLVMRKALLMPPVLETEHDIATIRQTLESNVRKLIAGMPLGAGKGLDPVAAIERVHFYLVYYGWAQHDRVIQELVSQMYLQAWPDLLHIAPHCHSPSRENITPRSLVKVGFLSRFFGEKEPHGLLLDGIIRHLPRSRFNVHALVIPHRGKPLSTEIAEGADEVHRLSLNYMTARTQIEALGLDVLVFGEMNSEPLNHFLGFSRMAPLQLLFWGNPITSGNPSIDYFISADIMEHPYRTHLAPSEEPYTEQVVLLDGQGIWYYQPELPSPWEDRSPFGLDEEWTIYLCAQSVFKMHPMMDTVFAQILQQDRERGHIVFLQGRRKRWTEVFKARLTAAGIDMQRVHFLSRIPAGDRYLQLLHVADVILHPFPFGGSRTSAEALLVKKPMVVLRNNLLRGRMAASFYRTMGMPEHVVDDVDAYISMAVQLGQNMTFRKQVEVKIEANVSKIWNRMDVVYEWARFLARITGQEEPVSPLEVGYPSIEAYLADEAMYEEVDFRGESLRTPFLSADPSLNESESLNQSSCSLSYDVGGKKIKSDTKEENQAFSRLVTYARRLHSMGQVDAALEVWSEALARRPNDIQILNDMGAVLQESWRLEEAEGYLRRAVELAEKAEKGSDQYRRVLNNLAVTLHSGGHLDEAIECYTRCLGNQTWRDAGADLYVSNLGNLLRDTGRLRTAVDLFARHLDLPSIERGGGLVALLSLLDLRSRHEGPLKALERHLISEEIGALELPPGETLSSLIGRLKQNDNILTTNSMVIFLDRLGELHPSPEEIIEVLSHMEPPSLLAADMLSRIHDANTFQAQVLPTQQEVGELHLIVGYYRVNDNNKIHNNPTRQAELDLCLLQNLVNPYISHVHLLLDQPMDDPKSFIPKSLLPKLRLHILGHRPTFKDAFMYAEEVLSGQLCILANADIFFDHSLSRLYPPAALSLDNEVMALLRWEVQDVNLQHMKEMIDRQAVLYDEQDTARGGRLMARFKAFHQAHTHGDGGGSCSYRSRLQPRIDSQDAWILRAPLLLPMDELDFELGRPRCDNHLAAILMDAGLSVTSPSFALRSHHLHQQQPHQPSAAEGGTDSHQSRPYGYTGEDQVNGKLAFVLLSDQWLF